MPRANDKPSGNKTGSNAYFPASDRKNLRARFRRFVASPNTTTLSKLLKSEMSSVETQALRFSAITLGSDVSTVEVDSYKKRIQDVDRRLFERVKSFDGRLSDNVSRINSLLRLTSEVTTSGRFDSTTFGSSRKAARRNWFSDVQQIVSQVCAKLRQEILTQGEVRQIMSQKGSPLQDFSDEEPMI